MRLIALFLVSPFWVISQNWTLDQCIDTAIQNSAVLKSGVLRSQIASVNLQASKQNLFPSLNAGAVHGYNWGQTIDLFTNQFASNRVMYDNFYLSSSVVLFSGLKNYYAIKSNALAIDEALVDRQVAERNIKIDVSAAFLQVLLNKEMVSLSEDTRRKTQEQYKRMEELVGAKQATQAELMEIEAELRLDDYLLLKAGNDLNYSKLLLQQLLNIPVSPDFEVLDIFPDVQENLVILDSAISKSPEMIKIELGIQKQGYLIKSTKGRYYPSLTLNGAIGTGYSQNNKVLTPSGNYVSQPFNDQLNNNLYQSLFATLNIPIFNKNANRSQLKIQQLELQSLHLKKQDEYNQLKQRMDQLSLEILNTSSQLEAMEAVYSSVSLNRDNFEIRFENGNVTYTELTEARNKFVKAKSELLQAKYQLIFKKIILGFYFS